MAKSKKPAAKETDSLSFDFIKSNYFRVIHMDGAFGGLSPNGTQIHMAIWNERRALPKRVVHPLKDGTLGMEDMAKRDVRPAHVREVEVDVVMDLETATHLRIWLDDKIRQLQNLQQEALARMTKETVKPKSNGSKIKG